VKCSLEKLHSNLLNFPLNLGKSLQKGLWLSKISSVYSSLNVFKFEKGFEETRKIIS